MAISEEELLLILQQKFPNAKIKLKDLIALRAILK